MKPFPYEDIISLPYAKSNRHPAMPASKRAAQFLPFASLAGYNDVIAETERLTDEEILQDESERDRMDILLNGLLSEDSQTVFTFLVFQPDEKKAGGSYETVTGPIKSLNQETGSLMLKNGQVILLKDILTVHPAENE